MNHTRGSHFFTMLAVTFCSVAETPCIRAAEPAVARTARSTIVTAGPLKFEERLIRDKYGYAYGLSAVDIDRDGDLDLTSADATKNFLYWFENDGKANFTPRLIYEKDPKLFERRATLIVTAGPMWPS